MGVSVVQNQSNRVRLLRHWTKTGQAARERAAQVFVPRPLSIALSVAAACGAVALGPAAANPTGAQVASGSATITQQGATLVIKNTPNAIINWQSFSIAAGQTTNFIQQSIASSVLNRVVGVNPSSILGTLTSNGKVFLVNPNGVVFGEGSNVNAAGLVVSTLNLTDADFTSGNLHFTGDASAGNIALGGIVRSSNGDVYLIAPNVTNTGSIGAVNGNVILAAGQTVDILGRGLDDIKFEVQNRSNQAINLGQIDGDAVGLFAGTLQQAGVVNASAVSVQGGQVVLSAEANMTLAAGSSTRADGAGPGGSVTLTSASGDVAIAAGATVSASGSAGGTIQVAALEGHDTIAGALIASGSGPAAKGTASGGGSIEALGQDVTISHGAFLDAAGNGAGGTVFVGGGLHGSNSAVPDALQTTIAPGAVISADAVQKGDGGSVVIFGENSATIDGQIYARGGASGGNGGYIETSSHGDLEVALVPDAASRKKGAAGLWYLDPGDVTIGTADGNNEVSVATLLAGLQAENVTISTGSYPNTGGATQDGEAITVAAPILVTNLPASRTLTLEAAGNIDVQQNITNGANNGNVLNVVLAANSPNTGNPDEPPPIPATGTGTVTIGSNVTIATGGGAFTASGYSVQNAGVVSTSGTSTVPNAGSVTMTITGSGVLEAGTIVANGAAPGGNAGAITLSNPTGEMFITSISAIPVGDGSGIELTLNAAGNISATGAVTIPGGLLQASAGGQGLSLTNENNVIPGIFEATASGGSSSAVNIVSNVPTFNVGTVSSTGAVFLTNSHPGGLLQISGSVQADTGNAGNNDSIQLTADRFILGGESQLSANGNNGVVVPDFVLIQPFSVNTPVVLTGQSYDNLPNGAFPGALVIADEVFQNTITPVLEIGNPDSGFSKISSINITAAGGSGFIAAQPGTLVSLNAPTITQSASTPLRVDALNINATSASLTAANTNTLDNNTNAVFVSGTAMTQGGSLTVNTEADATLVIGKSLFANGILGYGTVVLNSPSTLVNASIIGPTSGSLSVTSSGSLTVGSTTGTTNSKIQATGDLDISVASNLSVLGSGSEGVASSIGSTGGNTTISAPGSVLLQGGAGLQASATIDPANLTITAGALQLTGGGGPSSYAALEAAGNILLTIQGAITLTGGGGANADAAILSTGGTTTYSAAECVHCNVLPNGNVLTNDVTNVGFFPTPIVIGTTTPPPPPPPPTSVTTPVATQTTSAPLQTTDVAGLLANQNEVIQDVPLTDAPQGSSNATIVVQDPRECGGGF